MTDLPSGTVTFLFTDLEGSTRLWQDHPEAMRSALARHDEILRDEIKAHNGQLIKSTGDGVFAVFARAHDALDAAVAMQRGLAAESFERVGSLAVRMGLHTCEAEYRDGDYFGSEVNRAARLMGVAHGGQIVVSLSTSALIREGAFELIDLGEHRLRDLTNRERIFQPVAPGLVREFPPLRSLESAPGNLPRQVTTFIGRERDIAAVAERVHESSVVTLTGVGGVGKTRLALQVAAEVIPHFRDGAWLAELAGVRDPEALPEALLATFGLQPRGGLSPSDSLLEFLSGKDLLLVLDNCEHLLRAVAGLVDDIIRACPGVRILATSREGLNVGGERMLSVSSLDLPEPARPWEEIAQCDAVALFEDRARAVKASFAVDETNAEAVGHLCRRLDGIALAIELAAARVGVLTPAEIARRLDSRFRLLAAGQRTAVERHQTLRAAIDWSYELLGAAERLLLARLSVFAGGFGLEAAEAVAAGEPVAPDDVFELLATLVARSLVVADTEGSDARFRLLETIRQYAQEQLDTSGDGERLHVAHAAYYARFAEVAVPNISGPAGMEWEQRFKREYDNIRAALTWATDTRDIDVALRLLGMWEAPYLLTDAGVISTLIWSCDTVLSIPQASAHPRYPAALGIAAFLAWTQGAVQLARQRCDEAVAAEERLGTEPSTIIRAAAANVALAQGKGSEAVDQVRAAVALCRARGEPTRLASTLAQSALIQSMFGDSAAALHDAEEAVDLIARLANPHVVEAALAMVAFASANSDPVRALGLAREAVAMSSPGANFVWAIAGDIAARNGERQEALAYFAKSIDRMHWFGERLPLGAVLARVASLLADSDPEASAVLQGAGEAITPGFAHAPHHVEAQGRAIKTIDSALGETRRQELHTRGAAMTYTDAVEYALAAIARCLDGQPTNRER